MQFGLSGQTRGLLAGLSALAARLALAALPLGESLRLGIGAQALDHRGELLFDAGLLGLRGVAGRGLGQEIFHAVHRIDDVLVGPAVDDAIHRRELIVELGGGGGEIGLFAWKLGEANRIAVADLTVGIVRGFIDRERIGIDLLLGFENLLILRADGIAALLLLLILRLLCLLTQSLLGLQKCIERFDLRRIIPRPARRFSWPPGPVLTPSSSRR